MTVITPNTTRSAPTKPQQATKRDMPTVALTAWFDFEIARCDIEAINARLLGYEARLEKAHDWFLNNKNTPQKQRHAALGLALEIENNLDDDRAIRQMRARSALHHLWNVVLACEALEAPESVPDEVKAHIHLIHAPRGSEDATTRVRGVVSAAWHNLLPNTPMPAYMPDDHRANWVEWRLGAVATWSLDELQEALAERKQS